MSALALLSLAQLPHSGACKAQGRGGPGGKAFTWGFDGLAAAAAGPWIHQRSGNHGAEGEPRDKATPPNSSQDAPASAIKSPSGCKMHIESSGAGSRTRADTLTHTNTQIIRTPLSQKPRAALATSSPGGAQKRSDIAAGPKRAIRSATGTDGRSPGSAGQRPASGARQAAQLAALQ